MQDFVFLTLQAYMRGRGVRAAGLKRIPSLSHPEYMSEQCQLRRVAPLRGTAPQDYPVVRLETFKELLERR